ncbi:hypothetical protein EV421DRAFT_1739397 [Armillaria borealis]|uniref:Uncharacterized protein n=1 Tax=Armillaria borealis TaxID=47425 RepID=A0AA39MKF2_9AGAR|nr:hypothetical protein EV421DRAFT_1739397 [Armillaria borealis]
MTMLSKPEVRQRETRRVRCMHPVLVSRISPPCASLDHGLRRTDDFFLWNLIFANIMSEEASATITVHAFFAFFIHPDVQWNFDLVCSPLPPSSGDIRRTTVQPVARHSEASPGGSGSSGNESQTPWRHEDDDAKIHVSPPNDENRLEVVSSRPRNLKNLLASERAYIEEEDLAIGSGVGVPTTFAMARLSEGKDCSRLRLAVLSKPQSDKEGGTTHVSESLASSLARSPICIGRVPTMSVFISAGHDRDGDASAHKGNNPFKAMLTSFSSSRKTQHTTKLLRRLINVLKLTTPRRRGSKSTSLSFIGRIHGVEGSLPNGLRVMVCDLVATIPPFPVHNMFSEETISLNEDKSEREVMVVTVIHVRRTRRNTVRALPQSKFDSDGGKGVPR